MKKLFVLSTALSIIGITIGILPEKRTRYSDIALANIEAIMGMEDSSEKENEKCSRYTETANCYRRDEQTGRWEWCNLRITAVEEYYRTSVVVICHHDVITQCISNCEQK